MRNINILLICSNLSYAGAQRQMLVLAKGLNKKYNVIVCSISSNTSLISEYQKNEIPVIIIGKRMREFGVIVNSLFQIVKKNNIQIIYSFLAGANFLSRIIKIIIPSVKVISSERLSNNKAGWIKKFYEKILSKYTNLYIANSNAGKMDLVNNFNFAKNRIKVIHNGIDINRFEQIKAPKMDVDIVGKLNIVMIGRIKPQKNHEMFLDVADSICQKYTNVNFISVGDHSKKNTGYYEKIMKKYNKMIMKKNIYFVGARSDIPSILSIADISILTSHREGCSNAVLESMYAKCPLVVTDVGDNKMMLSDVNQNFVTKRYDVPDMVNKLSTLIENPDLRKKIGEANFKKAKNEFTSDNMVNKTESAILKLLDKKK